MTLQIRDQARVRTILLDRPERLNAFNVPLVNNLSDALEAAAADPEVAVIVLSGIGRAFSAGADLKELAAYMATRGGGAIDPGAGLSMFARLIDTLADLDKPLLIAVNGVGVGFGMTVLAFADLVFMSTEARLRCPFTALGAPPEAASTYLLPLLLGRQNAAWVLFSSEWVSASEALDMGLVWKLCEPDDLLATAQRHAELLAEKPVPILKSVKRLLNAPQRDAIVAAVERENAAMAEMLSTGLSEGALDAFTSRDQSKEGKET